MVAYACDIRWGPFVDMRDQDEDPAYDQFITEFEGRWGPLTPATLNAWPVCGLPTGPPTGPQLWMR